MMKRESFSFWPKWSTIISLSRPTVRPTFSSWENSLTVWIRPVFWTYWTRLKVVSWTKILISKRRFLLFWIYSWKRSMTRSVLLSMYKFIDKGDAIEKVQKWTFDTEFRLTFESSWPSIVRQNIQFLQLERPDDSVSKTNLSRKLVWLWAQKFL